MIEKPTYEELEQRVKDLEQEKLESLKDNSENTHEFVPEDIDLKSIVSIEEVQSILNDFHALTNMVTAILNMKGEIIEATGWQDICTKFHRVHPETSRNCTESDLYLSRELKPGEYVEYQCKNGLWDVVTPLYVGTKHLGNIFTGQFFYDDDEVDENFFIKQAEKYGFDQASYLDAFRRIPRYSRKTIKHLMNFLVKFTTYISRISLVNLQLEKEINKRKKIDRERARLHADLNAKNEELEQIVYVASHDLRSPLVNIDGYGKELEYAVKDIRNILFEKSSDDTIAAVETIMDEDIQESLKFIRTSTTKMDKLLSGLLRLSRSGRASLKISFLDINLMLSKVVDSTEFKIRKTGAEVIIEDLPQCHGDPIQIDQVFSNLLENALKYLDKNRQGRIKISGKVMGDHSVYCVEDNGIGIHKNHMEKIFEIFHQLKPDQNDGEGLGLTIVKRILGRLKGSIRVESELGQGSRFYVSLPKCRENH